MQTRALRLPFQLLAEELISVPAWLIWWYGEGFVGVAKYLVRTISFRASSYALAIWMRDLFVPMYGQVDWTGRLVSLLMRIVVISYRSIALFVEAIMNVMLALLWLTIPVLGACLIGLPFFLRV